MLLWIDFTLFMAGIICKIDLEKGMIIRKCKEEQNIWLFIQVIIKEGNNLTGQNYEEFNFLQLRRIFVHKFID